MALDMAKVRREAERRLRPALHDMTERIQQAAQVGAKHVVWDLVEHREHMIRAEMERLVVHGSGVPPRGVITVPNPPSSGIHLQNCQTVAAASGGVRGSSFGDAARKLYKEMLNGVSPSQGAPTSGGTRTGMPGKSVAPKLRELGLDEELESLEQDVPDPPDLPERETTEPFVGYRAWNAVKVAELVEDSLPSAEAFMGRESFPAAHPIETTESWLLVSPTQRTTWRGPIMRADGVPCPYDPHDDRWQARDDHCHGIYAHDEPEWKDSLPPPEVKWSLGTSLTVTNSDAFRAMGEVELTGTVVVHERGYRAEAARITKLWLPPQLMNETDVVSDLERRYQCEVSFDPTILNQEHRCE